MPCNRRTYLSLLAGAGSAGLAGCLGGDDAPTTDASEPNGGSTPPDPTTPTATGTPSGTATTTARATPTGATLVLERIDGTPTVPLTVYSPALRGILREAATTDGVVRAHAETTPDAPRARLPSFGAVELVDETGAADGTYAVEGEGGVRYQMSLRAEEVPRPDGPVTAVSDLSGERRRLLERAIREELPGVMPETELGEWARDEVFGHYFEREGTCYRVTETHATDAAFFSNSVWYVLSLAPVEASDPPRLRLRAVDDDVRSALDRAVAWTYRQAPERSTVEYDPVPEALASFVAETGGILTHTSAVRLSLDR